MKKENKILNFFITTLNGMAYGLFATLIVGTIIGSLAKLFFFDNSFCKFFNSILSSTATCLQFLTGAGIGVGIAISMKLSPLKTIVVAAIGELAAYFSLSTTFVGSWTISDPKFQIGDPLTIYLVCIASILLMELVLKKKTPVDILIVPLFGILVGLTLSLLIRFPAIFVTYGIQFIVDKGTTAAPFIMGIVVSVVMGMALTAPISSAAIAAMIFVSTEGATPTGLAIASGAAIIGCCTQMVGFAIQSRKDNPIGVVISIGIGTSMLQFKNILKKPIIWLPTIIASAILGPISTCLVKVVCMGSSAGMGTAGLVGQIGTFMSMSISDWRLYVGVFVLEIIAPAILVYLIDLLFRKFNLIKEGDLKV
ncbi:MAG: PTS sugar transporter subunit IIC [Bacilli bacterium]